MTQRHRITLAYDGALYAGWQVQPGRRTIQGELERVLKEITRATLRVHCSGRTDSGVHARAQVAHFDLANAQPLKTIHSGMNALLDPDIRVLSVRRAPDDFHARLSATGKEYRYFIWNDPILPPPIRLYRTHVVGKLDSSAMAVAAASLVGRHDFAAFSANPNREVHGTVRRLEALEVRSKGHEITIVARGEGFLYKMVRSLAGFLIRVGAGELAPETAEEILASRTRTARVPTAQPQGLFLWKVFYGTGPGGVVRGRRAP